MVTSKVEISGVDTSTLPVLANKRMRELFPLVHGGDQAAREELIRGNLRLVLSVVQRFNNRGENADDLFQVGCIGLIKALDHFDVSRNVRFSTCAVPMIIGEIRRSLRDNNPLRVSRSLRDTAYKALQARGRLVLALNREPTVEEMTKELGVPREDVVFALEAIQGPISLFEPVYNDGGDAIYIMDQVKDDAQIAGVEGAIIHIVIHGLLLGRGNDAHRHFVKQRGVFLSRGAQRVRREAVLRNGGPARHDFRVIPHQLFRVDAAVHFQQIRVPVQVIKILQQGEIQRGFHVGTSDPLGQNGRQVHRQLLIADGVLQHRFIQRLQAGDLFCCCSCRHSTASSRRRSSLPSCR